MNASKLEVILVAGSNGKGSVCAILENALRENNYKTGLYTSPHLFNVRERIRVNGKNISEKNFSKILKTLKPFVKKHNAKREEKLSFFEVLTVTAIKHFLDEKTDIAIIETGMGGRLDATNVLTPHVSVITNVSLEHQSALGETIEKIAREKAGVIRQSAVLVTAAKGKALNVLKKECKNKKSNLVAVKTQKRKITVALKGAFQQENASVALAVLKELSKKGRPRLSQKAVQKGFESVKWQGRFETVGKNPVVVFDTAHNPAGAKALVDSLRAIFPKKKIVFVVAVMKDKNVEKIAGELSKIASFMVATKAKIAGKRNASPSRIAKNAKCKVIREKDSREALKKAKKLAGKNGVVCVAGSLYLVGELRQLAT